MKKINAAESIPTTKLGIYLADDTLSLCVRPAVAFTDSASRDQRSLSFAQTRSVSSRNARRSPRLGSG